MDTAILCARTEVSAVQKKMNAYVLILSTLVEFVKRVCRSSGLARGRPRGLLRLGLRPNFAARSSWGVRCSCGEDFLGSTILAEPQHPAYMIQSSQPVWSAARSQICLNPVWRVGCEGSRSEPERSEGERSESADWRPPSQLDSDKFGDEAAKPNRWLD